MAPRVRFFLDSGPIESGATVEVDALAHQLHSVLRLKPGDAVTLLDDSGREFAAHILALSARHALVQVGEGVACPAEPRLALTLYTCSLKGEKYEWVLQKGTELGVRRFVPVISSRSIVRPAAALEGKYPRWRSVLREAAEQSGRGRLPELAPAMDYADAVASARGTRLLAWEGAPTGGQLPLPASDVSLLIGPEGGLSEAEVEMARTQAWHVISLGPRILRAESASIAAVAVLMALAGEMGDLGRSGSEAGEIA